MKISDSNSKEELVKITYIIRKRDIFKYFDNIG